MTATSSVVSPDARGHRPSDTRAPIRQARCRPAGDYLATWSTRTSSG
jgi:hypothetical protein